MKEIIILAILSLVLCGCSRYIESDSLSVQLPDPPPVPLDLRLVHFDEGLQVTWQVSDTDIVSYFKVYYGTDTILSHMSLWDTTSLFVEVLDNLVSGQSYSVAVSAVVRGLEGEKSRVVTTTPGVLSMLINNNDRYAKSRNVNISFVVPIAARLLQLSENVSFADAVWENYSASKNFTLSEGDGLKRVYARFRFGDGSSSSTSVYDEITLDTRAEVDSVYFRPSETVFSAGDMISFYLRAAEDGGQASVSFPGRSNLELYDDGTHGDAASGDRLFSRAYTIPLNLEVSQGLVTGSFQDVAGNASSADLVASEYLTIANPPVAVTLAAQLVTDNEGNRSISLSWTASPDSDFETYRLYRDKTAGIQANETNLVIWITASKSQTTFSDINPGTGTYYYRVFVYDQQGLATGSNEVSIVVP
jgi:hypothetical protein